VTIVGSNPSSTLPIHPGFGLAPEQFSIRMVSQGAPWLEDRSGMSSTLVNGRPVQQQQLVHGDIISAGQLSLIFVGEELLQKQPVSTAAVPPPVQHTQTTDVPAAAQQVAHLPQRVPQTAVVSGYVPQLGQEIVAAVLTPEATQMQSSGQPTSLPPLSEKAVAEAMLSLRANNNRPVFFDPTVNDKPLPELPHRPQLKMKELLEQFINAQNPPAAPVQLAQHHYSAPPPTIAEPMQVAQAAEPTILPAQQATASVVVGAPLQIPAICLDGIKTLSNHSTPLPAIRSDPAPATAPLDTGNKKKNKKLLFSGGLLGILSTVMVLAAKFGYVNLPWLTQIIGGN
jgi:hypothetical protein